MEESEDINVDVLKAEELLHCAEWQQARELSSKVLNSTAAPCDITRAFYVLLQVEFQENKLSKLDELAAQFHRSLQGLPVTVVLLWGVIAVELAEAALAREVLGKYVASFATGPAPSREDAMALSRLYALRVLATLSADTDAARNWLQAGGAGLAPDQQQLLLSELDEATGAAAAAGAGAASAAAQQGAGGVGASAASRCSSGYVTMLGELGGLAEFDGVAGDASGSFAGGTLTPRPAPSAAATPAGGSGSAQRGGEGGMRALVSASGSWVRDQASRWWTSPIVQDTLQALSMHELTPAQLAGCSAAAALLSYSLYRERRALRRGATRLAAAAWATAGMALGFAPDAMAAAPNSAYAGYR